jgi:glycosyltransferase involved in cell wall biosynthesis
MKVIHAVASNAFAGVERYIATVAPRLATRGLDVTVLGGEPTAMRGALGDAVTFVPAATTVALTRALRGMSADVVHVHMTDAEWAAVVARPRARALVSTRHFVGRRGKSLGGRAVAGLIRRRLDHQISISEIVASSIGEPSTHIPNGVANRPVGAHRGTNVVVLQRLEPEKETALALQAWALSGARGAGWSLDIAGAGSQEAALRALAAELGVADTVRFMGHLSDPEALLADAGVVLATAPCEPFGLSVVEAMAVAAPVVAAAGGGHLETVSGVADARVFPPGDAPACALRLDELIGDAPARAAYGRALQQRQRDLFDIDDHVSRVIELYERVV